MPIPQPPCTVADWFADIPAPRWSYAVRLVDCTDAISAADQNAVGAQLTSWILAANGTRPAAERASVKVEWSQAIPTTTTAAVVVYFVTDRDHSVLRFMRNFSAPANWDALAGLTVASDSVRWIDRAGVRTITRDEHLSASEVYTSKSADAAAMAMFAFHEAMHNQLHMGNEMHTDRVAGGGIAAEKVAPGTTPTAANLWAFGATMGGPRAQWIDGYARAHPTTATQPLRH